MPDQAQIKSDIFLTIQGLMESDMPKVGEETALLGDGSVLDSMKLVELCLALEDKAADLGFQFDWTSETALSRSHSMFRTGGTLAAEFLAQMSAQV